MKKKIRLFGCLMNRCTSFITASIQAEDRAGYLFRQLAGIYPRIEKTPKTIGMWNEVWGTGQWWDWHAILCWETLYPLPLWLNRALTTAQEDLFACWFMKWAVCSQALKTTVLKGTVYLRNNIDYMGNKQ